MTRGNNKYHRPKKRRSTNQTKIPSHHDDHKQYDITAIDTILNIFDDPRAHKIPKDSAKKAITTIVQFLIQENIISAKEITIAIGTQNCVVGEVNTRLGNRLSQKELKALWVEEMRKGKLFCSLCGQPIQPQRKCGPGSLTAEHYVPKSKGGASDSTNLYPAHAICNTLKTNYMPEVWNKIGKVLLESRGIKVDVENSIFKYNATTKQHVR